MRVNANSSTARKQWRTCDWEFGHWLFVTVDYGGVDTLDVWHNITGASPAYVEALVEELNIRINEMLYNLGRISRE